MGATLGGEPGQASAESLDLAPAESRRPFVIIEHLQQVLDASKKLVALANGVLEHRGTSRARRSLESLLHLGKSLANLLELVTTKARRDLM